ASGDIISRRLFNTGQPTDAGPDDDANAVGILFGDIKATVFPCLQTRSQTVMDEGIHLARLFGGHQFSDIESPDFAGNVAIEISRIKTGNAADAGTAIDEVVPGGGDVVAYRGNNTETGDADASLH